MKFNVPLPVPLATEFTVVVPPRRFTVPFAAALALPRINPLLAMFNAALPNIFNVPVPISGTHTPLPAPVTLNTAVPLRFMTPMVVVALYPMVTDAPPVRVKVPPLWLKTPPFDVPPTAKNPPTVVAPPPWL